MKTLYESLLDDFEDIEQSQSDGIVQEIINFLETNYSIRPNSTRLELKFDEASGLYLVNYSGDVKLNRLANSKFKSLTSELSFELFELLSVVKLLFKYCIFNYRIIVI